MKSTSIIDGIGQGTIEQRLIESFRIILWGTYPRDLIPHRSRPYEKAIVVNTDPHDKPGTHWVCLYVVPPVVEYFDSYGMKPFFPEILNFIDRHQSRAVWNPFDYQALNTTVCGHPRVLFITKT